MKREIQAPLRKDHVYRTNGKIDAKVYAHLCKRCAAPTWAVKKPGSPYVIQTEDTAHKRTGRTLADAQRWARILIRVHEFHCKPN